MNRPWVALLAVAAMILGALSFAPGADAYTYQTVGHGACQQATYGWGVLSGPYQNGARGTSLSAFDQQCRRVDVYVSAGGNSASWADTTHSYYAAAQVPAASWASHDGQLCRTDGPADCATFITSS